MAELTLSLKNVTDTEMFASIPKNAVSLGQKINELELEIDGDFTNKSKRFQLNSMREVMQVVFAAGDIVKSAQFLALIKTQAEKEATSI